MIWDVIENDQGQEYTEIPVIIFINVGRHPTEIYAGEGYRQAFRWLFECFHHRKDFRKNTFCQFIFDWKISQVNQVAVSYVRLKDF